MLPSFRFDHGVLLQLQRLWIRLLLLFFCFPFSFLRCSSFIVFVWSVVLLFALTMPIFHFAASKKIAEDDQKRRNLQMVRIHLLLLFYWFPFSFLLCSSFWLLKMTKSSVLFQLQMVRIHLLLLFFWFPFLRSSFFRKVIVWRHSHQYKLSKYVFFCTLFSYTTFSYLTCSIIYSFISGHPGSKFNHGNFVFATKNSGFSMLDFVFFVADFLTSFASLCITRSLHFLTSFTFTFWRHPLDILLGLLLNLDFPLG